MGSKSKGPGEIHQVVQSIHHPNTHRVYFGTLGTNYVSLKAHSRCPPLLANVDIAYRVHGGGNKLDWFTELLFFWCVFLPFCPSFPYWSRDFLQIPNSGKWIMLEKGKISKICESSWSAQQACGWVLPWYFLLQFAKSYQEVPSANFNKAS